MKVPNLFLFAVNSLLMIPVFSETAYARVQIRDLVEMSHQVSSIEMAHLHESLIHDTFLELKELNENNLESVCSTLGALENFRDLIPFEEEIQDESNALLEGCRSTLLQKLQFVYNQDRAELQARYGAPEAQANPCDDAIGSAPPIEVETEGGMAYGSYTLLRHHERTKRIPGLKDHEIILTLDDGPTPYRSDKILESFRKNCVKATFFVIGQQVVRTNRTDPTQSGVEILKREMEAGHNIANHTWDHQYFSSAKLNNEKRKEEILKNDTTIRRANEQLKAKYPLLASIFTLTPFFRFPGGIETPDALSFLESKNMPSFTWEAGANDWFHNITAAEELIEALAEIEAYKGGVLLLHDRVQATADMVPYLLPELKRRGYKIRQMIPKNRLY